MQFLADFPEGIEANENTKVVDITDSDITVKNVAEFFEGTNFFNFYKVEDKQYLVVAKTAVIK